ncbi:hypothetical protein GIB67_008035 [Kingdonia uniflora]|uniref:Uncharacterized protein n=1 Tax=Kingdonia uniflora TaxID=39325 RepID=A0A7J7MMT8_9MAGN|nr:hypothetical protein GIB67_008035 [Kingdonia uniflora]
MASISGCTKVEEADLVGQLTPVIGVGDEEDIVAELIEWPRLKSFGVEYPIGSSWFWEFCKAKSSIDGIWGHAFAYRGNFFKTCSVSQRGDYLYLLPDLAKKKKCRHLGDEVSLEYAQGVVKDSQTDGFCCYLAQFDYGLTLPLGNLAKSAASGCEKKITAKDFLEYYTVKYVTTTDGAYLSSSSSRPCFFDLSLAGRVWNDNLLWVSGECLQRSEINCKVLRKESFIDVVAREGTELKTVLKELEISRLKRVANKDDKVRRSQAKWILARKTPSSMEEKLSTPELNTPLRLVRLNEILDGPVDVATVSSTVVRNLAKRKTIKCGAAPRSVTSVSVDNSSNRRKVTSLTKSQEVLEESDKMVEGADLRPRYEVGAGLLEEQCRAKAREKMVVVMDDVFKEFARALKDVQLGFQDRLMELEKRISQLEGEKNQLEENLTREREAFQLERKKEREAAALKLKEVRAESEAEAERLVIASAISRNNLAGKLYQLRYTKAEIMASSEGNYEEMEIMDEEEVEERKDGLNVAEKTAADNQETIKQYEDRLDDNVKLSLKLEEAKRQVEQKTATILCRDLALNQLTSELVELKEKAMSGSRHEAELAEYRIRALNEEISNMKCNIRALNEQLLKREIKLDTARTNLAVSEASFEKLNSSIMGKDRELRNSTQIRDSLIARLDHVKADLRRVKGREAQCRDNLAEIQAKNKSLVDDLAHAHGNVRRAVQHEKEMNERINQLCARISESERELRVREMKYQKDLKFELDKEDGKIASGGGNREMKEFLRRKEELVENMRINLTNSR